MQLAKGFDNAANSLVILGGDFARGFEFLIEISKNNAASQQL
jgi:hypothetical protein